MMKAIPPKAIQISGTGSEWYISQKHTEVHNINKYNSANFENVNFLNLRERVWRVRRKRGWRVWRMRRVWRVRSKTIWRKETEGGDKAKQQSAIVKQESTRRGTDVSCRSWCPVSETIHIFFSRAFRPADRGALLCRTQYDRLVEKYRYSSRKKSRI